MKAEVELPGTSLWRAALSVGAVVTAGVVAVVLRGTALASGTCRQSVNTSAVPPTLVSRCASVLICVSQKPYDL